MNFDELIQLKALELKATISGAANPLTDALLESGELKTPATRNLCAYVAVELFDEVDGICKMLGMSKRAFVEAALLAAVERARSVIDQVDPIPSEGV